MQRTTKRPLVIRLLSSWALWALLFLVLLSGLVVWGSTNFRSNITESQAQFVADNVRRSAIQCYAIEGRFPSTQDGVKYLEETYGLAIDHERYRVYYESIGANIIPQIRVVVIPGGAIDAIVPSVSVGIIPFGGEE